MEENKNPRTNTPTDHDRLVSERSPGSNSEKKVDTASGNQTEISTNTGSRSQNSRKRKLSGSSRDPGMNFFFLSTAHDSEGWGDLLDFTEVLFLIEMFQYC